MSERILRLPEVQRKTGKSRSGIYEDIRAGLFPHQVPIGRRAVGWLESEVTSWLIAQCQDGRTQARIEPTEGC